jgi:uncharacterized membrane protein
MSLPLFLILLGAFALILAAVVLLLVTYSELRALQRRTERLEESLRALRAAPSVVEARTAPAVVDERAAPATSAPSVRAPWSSQPPVISPTQPESEHAAPSVASRESAASSLVSPERAAPSLSSTESRIASAPHGASAQHGASTRSTSTPLSRERTEWERWIGVRAAAVAGAVVLGIAALTFFQYSIQNEWITPPVCVALGIAVGIACIAGAEILRRRGYDVLANALTGGGSVVLYAASWSAYRVFGIWPFALSFAAMALVTAACCVLAQLRSSQLIAVLGLVGGFATPLVLASGRDNPVGLFGYVLLIDLGFLFVAGRRRWPAVGVVGLLGTFAIEALWIFDRMRPDTFALGLVILGVFALLFTALVQRQPTSERARWMIGQAGAVLLPFVFALYFVQHAGVGADAIGRHIYPTALLCALLCAAASWIARMQSAPFVPAGAAAGTAAVVLVWVFANDLDRALAWELVIASIGLAAVLHVFCEWRTRRADAASALEIRRGHDVAAIALDVGLFAAWIAAGWRRDVALAPLAPFVAGFVALALLFARGAASSGVGYLHVVAAIATGIGVWAATSADPGRAVEPIDILWLLAALTALFLLVALVRRDPSGRHSAWRAAVCFGVLAMCLSTEHADALVVPVLAFDIGFGLATAIAATGARSGFGLGIGAVMCAAVQARLIEDRGAAGADLARQELPLVLLGAALFTLWPFVRVRAWRESKSVWRVSAASALLWLVAVRELYVRAFTREHVGLVPLALAVLPAIGLALLGRVRSEIDGPTRDGIDRELAAHNATPLFIGRVWYASVALALVSLALPLELDRDVAPVSAALFALALAWLWKRLGHEPLRVLAALFLAAATVALVVPRFVQTFPRLDGVVVNWLAYTFLVPAAAAIAVSVWSRDAARDAQRSSRGTRSPVAAFALTCGLVLVFAWINLVIASAFGKEPRFDWSFEREPAHDMTVSIAWAVYALALLVLGVARGNVGLRWASLALLIGTIAKVFLFDLGSLGGLYRVASLLGLAVSLLSVSLLYQRFVFKNVPAL